MDLDRDNRAETPQTPLPDSRYPKGYSWCSDGDAKNHRAVTRSRPPAGAASDRPRSLRLKVPKDNQCSWCSDSHSRNHSAMSRSRPLAGEPVIDRDPSESTRPNAAGNRSALAARIGITSLRPDLGVRRGSLSSTEIPRLEAPTDSRCSQFPGGDARKPPRCDPISVSGRGSLSTTEIPPTQGVEGDQPSRCSGGDARNHLPVSRSRLPAGQPVVDRDPSGSSSPGTPVIRGVLAARLGVSSL